MLVSVQKWCGPLCLIINSKMKSTKVQTLGELRMRGTAN